MLMAYKTEISPTPDQQTLINKTIGVCRYVYNFFIAHNKERYEQGEKFMSGMDFSKWLNNEYLPNNPDKAWIKEVSAKAVKQSIMNAERAFKRFFKGLSGFPKFKKKSKSDVKMYFVKNDAKMVIHCERHRMKIPTLSWVRLKEKGYIPTNAVIRSGTVSYQAGRYYVSVIIEALDAKPRLLLNDFGIGVDLGVKDLAICSHGAKFENVNNTSTVRKIEKKLKREQRKLSRKYESLKQRNKNQEEGRATRQNIQKQVLSVQKLHQRLYNIRTNHINQAINNLVKTKPSYISVEDLNISGMMKNRHLSRAIAQQKFYEFRTKLENKCKTMGIELRVVDRFYPSSKLCYGCGHIKSDLKLSDRIYQCECGYTANRDFNASLNIKDSKKYKTA